MQNKVNNSQAYAFLLNFLMPGLGHLFWKETLFGVFIFVINIIAIILFFVSFFVPLSNLAKIFMFGLPVLFYTFTFIDLWKTVNRKRGKVVRSIKAVIIIFIISIIFQFGIPFSPGNFLIRNFPKIFYQSNNNVSPIYSTGDLLKANRLAYVTNLFFLDQPLMHTLPKRYEVILFYDEQKIEQSGIVVGLPSEEIEILDGVVVVNGLPDYENGPANFQLNGVCELTTGESFSIIIITLKFGVVDKVYVVPIENVIGKVTKLF